MALIVAPPDNLSRLSQEDFVEPTGGPKSPPTSHCPTLSLTTRLPEKGGKKSTVEEIKEVGDDDNDDVGIVKKKGNFIKTIFNSIGSRHFHSLMEV
ncbi:uncharacterized protein G2W53_022312 [Senna tora]|uniref:Uncharacterized protein n=1 Tax=Senna tora TaxID=362788 RepID=A0A834TL06_9FABA|nr:uncharacterized protein G2W53_022312 [Senna tora]